MKIVLDTNVLVSGLLSPFGHPAEIVRMVAAGNVSLCYDARILNEYRNVLLRPKFGIPPQAMEYLLEAIKADGLLITPLPLRAHLPDEDDEPFLEAAVAGKARALVTGNIRHYPERNRQNILVVSPAGFIELYQKNP